MESIIEYVFAVIVGLIAVWGGIIQVAAKTPTPKDDEFVAKVKPYADKAVPVAEKLTGQDLDGDGKVG
jgi:hypothetical protein